MATDLTGLSKALPSGLLARLATDDDLDAMVGFANRFATASQWQAPAAVRAMREASAEPLRLTLLVEGPAGIAATGVTSDGGVFRSGDGTWRVSLRVALEWQRRGIGAAMLDPLEAHARAKSAPRLVVAVNGTEPEGARFAERHGYRAFHERIDAFIDVPSFDPAPFEDPDVTAKRLGIRIATWAELLAENARDIESLQRALLPALWQMARDVPSPTPMPEEPPPFEQAKRMFFEGPGMDPGTTVVALRGGAPIGMTVTMVKENGTAYTNFTGVGREDRGKGIALALKLRALRGLKGRGVKLFGTTNDEQNAAMRGINRKMGYTPEAPTTMYEKKLT